MILSGISAGVKPCFNGLFSLLDAYAVNNYKTKVRSGYVKYEYRPYKSESDEEIRKALSDFRKEHIKPKTEVIDGEVWLMSQKYSCKLGERLSYDG